MTKDLYGIESYAERLFSQFATTEEVLNHLNNRIEKLKYSEFDFEELDFQYEFLHEVRKFILKKSKAE